MTARSRKILRNVVKVVISEIKQNPAFAEQIEAALNVESKAKHADKPNKASHRRAAAVLDPILLAQEGETALRKQLELLSLEELKDIVAGYGMDSGRLAMKWKNPERLIERIVKRSIARAHKGDAFMR